MNVLYIYTYIKYIHTTANPKITASVPPKKPSSDDPGVRHGFGIKVSLPLT